MNKAALLYRLFFFASLLSGQQAQHSQLLEKRKKEFIQSQRLDDMAIEIIKGRNKKLIDDICDEIHERMYILANLDYRKSHKEVRQNIFKIDALCALANDLHLDLRPCNYQFSIASQLYNLNDATENFYKRTFPLQFQAIIKLLGGSPRD